MGRIKVSLVVTLGISWLWDGRADIVLYLYNYCFLETRAGQILQIAEVCDECKSPAKLASSLHALSSRYHLSTSRLLSIQRACASCASTAVSEHVKCESVDCPVLYARVKAGNEVQDTEGLVGVINKLDKEERKGWTGEEIGPEVISLLDSDDE